MSEPVDYELTEHDFGPLRILMAHLESMPEMDGLERVEIHAEIYGQRYTIGYGEAGVPAVLIRGVHHDPDLYALLAERARGAREVSRDE